LSDKEPSIISRITPALEKTYLVNVAETLNNVVIPQLEGAARARATDCLRIISRIISDSVISDSVREKLLQGVDNDIEAALVEGEALQIFNAQGMEYLRSIKSSNCEDPAAGARRFDQDAFEGYLRSHPLGGENVSVTRSRLLPGGRSKITILVSQQGAKYLPRELVIRQDWANSVTGKTVAIEHNLLLLLFNRGLLVPQPLVYEKSADVLGNPFLVFPKISGAPVGDNFIVLPKSERPLMQLAAQLGRLHAMPGEDFESMVGISQGNYTAAQLRASLASFAENIDKLDLAGSALLEKSLQWLEENAEKVSSLPPVLVHGDMGFHNLLVDGAELRSILDWEMVHIGNPAYDLGYLRHAVSDEMLWTRFIDHYRRAGGLDIEPEIIEYYTLFTGIWFHQIQLQVRTALSQDAIRDIEISALCADFAPQVLASISHTLHRILKRVNQN
jgi:aminoglycoside phosphotransferase (APT) family kinase protein